jgi:hypothetical protein
VSIFVFARFSRFFASHFCQNIFKPLSNKVNLAKKLCECVTNPKLLSISKVVKLIFLPLSTIRRLTHRNSLENYRKIEASYWGEIG